MACNLSSSNDEDFVLEFSDDEGNDRIDQADNYDEKESTQRDGSQLMHDHALLKLENYSDFKDLKLNKFQDKIHKFLWEHSALPKHSPEKLQKSSTNMDKDRMVNVPTLIYQLLNAKVVIEKRCDSSEKILMSQTKCVLPNGSRFRDSIQRCCPKCKTVKVDKHQVTVKKSCLKCETALKYVCSKCNSKQYSTYDKLRIHWNQCEGAVLTADTCKKLNQSDFLVKKTTIDYASELLRYCSWCNKIEENCPKWVDGVCRNCKHHLLYQCNKCKAHYTSSKTLIYHMQTKCYPSQYKCNQCDFKNTSWVGIRKHVDAVHFGTAINCPRCDIVLKNIICLRTHLRYCGLEPKFNCHCCEFKTKYKDSLTSHMKTAHGK